MYPALLKCFYLLFSYFPHFIHGDNVFGLCGNSACSAPVGRGVTLIKYTSPDDYRITFGPNEEVEIFVKDYGPKKDLWGVMLNGHKGYISKNFIREVASYTKLLVPAATEFKNENVISSSYTMTSQVHVSSQWHQPDPHLNSDVHLLSQSIDYTQSLKADVVNSQVPSSKHEMGSLSSGGGNPSSVYTSSFAQTGTDGNLQAQLQSSVQMPSVSNPSSHFDYKPQEISPPPSSVPVMSGYENILPSSSYMSDMRETSAPYQQMVISHSTNFPQLVDSITVQNNFDNPSGFQSDNIQSGGIDPSNNLLSESFSQQTPGTESVHNIPPQVSLQQGSGASPGIMQPVSSQLEHFSVPHISPQLSPQQQVPLTNGYTENINLGGDADYSKTLAMLRDRGLAETEINQVQPNIVPDGFQSSHNWYPEQSGNALPSQSEYGAYQNSKPSPLYNYPNHLPLNNPSVENRVQYSSTPNAEQIISQTISEQITRQTISEQITMQTISEQPTMQTISEQPNSRVEGLSNTPELKNEINVRDSEDVYMHDDDDDDGGEEDNEDDEDENDEENSYVEDLKSSENLNMQNVFSSDASFESGNVEQLNTISGIEEDTIIPSKRTSEESPSHTQGPTISSYAEHEHLLNIQRDPSKSVFKQAESSELPLEIDISLNAKHGSSDNVLIKKDNIQTESNLLDNMKHSPNVENESASILDEDQNSDLDNILNRAYLDDTETEGDKNSYQIRNLKGEPLKGDQNVDAEVGNEENATQGDFSAYNSFENSLEALRSFIEALMMWIPEPLYSVIMDLDKKGIPPRVPVFTALSAVPCILLIITLVYMKEHSKENKLVAQLIVAEKNVYTLTAEKNVLEEKLENIESELLSLKASADEGMSSAEELKEELKHLQNALNVSKYEVEKNVKDINSLKQKENEYLTLLDASQTEKGELLEQKGVLENELKDKEDIISELTHQLEETRKELNEIQKEKLLFIQSKEDYEEKLTQLQQNCNQLLQEAEVWNARVNELNTKLNKEVTLKEDLGNDLKAKEDEIESLKLLVETFKAFEETEISEEEIKTREERMNLLMNSSSVLAKLQKQEDENKLLSEKLTLEKNKILDMEVEILDSRSEIDKLKLSYNQALQDKAEAQTKLEVLTNYFKDKEIQLQKQLGAQEAVRQKNEEDASSAERRICLIEQENASYKYQVASMKQEMEETERNLKSQIAAQEKKAHENWIAARAAERKLEDMKQEVTQLRQRLTLLEREQENWANLPRDDVIRPVPKRMPGLNDDSNSSQEINTSLDIRHGMFPQQLHERMPPPLMLPPDRPLPPLPPPPIPPFLPPLDPHFRPQPWHLRPDSVPSSDFRTTPPEFLRGRESTPPRGRQSTITDGDMGPHASSPLGVDTRDSRNSTPPHCLPDFHDIPPRPFFPPPVHHSRFPLPPPFRRDIAQGSKRNENQGEFNPSNRGTQQPSVPQERWQHSNTRV